MPRLRLQAPRTRWTPRPPRNLEAEKQRQGSNVINLRFCLTWHSYAVENEGDLLKQGPPEISDEQTLAAVPGGHHGDDSGNSWRGPSPGMIT